MFVKIHGLQKLKIRLYTKLVFNLKKYLKFIKKTVRSNAKAMTSLFLLLRTLFSPQTRLIVDFNH